MKTSTSLVGLCAAFLIAGTALAQTSQPSGKVKTPGIDAREKIQKQRIKEGVKSGELTRRETRRLAVEQKKIQRDEAKAKSDGTVTKKERAKLHHELNKSSRDIYRQKHDNQKRKN